MNRFVIITVGKTHSGKTTFANSLERVLNNCIVIDQDNNAEFINTFYKKLLPKQGANTIKYNITKTIVDYAIDQTNYHLILCNSNRNQKERLNLLRHFYEKGFITILVHFDIPDDILLKRVKESRRSTNIFRSASTFQEVLIRQQAESHKCDVMEPREGEADYLFVIKTSDEAEFVIGEIVHLSITRSD